MAKTILRRCPQSRKSELLRPTRPTQPLSTKLLLDRMHGFVESEAINAQQVRVLADAVWGWADELQELGGSTDRRSVVHVHGMLDALMSTAERLATLAGQVADNLAAGPEQDEGGDQAERRAVA